jgi:two-component SAPR family response regulator
MPVLNGIQLAKKLKKVNPSINIIFVTAYNNYALDAFNIHASGYIMKPVNENKLRDELDGLRYDLELKPNDSKLLQVKCFGNFEVFKNGSPVKFHRQKSKELFAYLVDREGSSANINELNAVLWEEDHKSYLRNLIVDIQETLKEAGIEDVFIKRYSECFIDPTKIDCDAYEYKKGNPDAIRMYRGEYMIQYSWAIFDDKDYY